MASRSLKFSLLVLAMFAVTLLSGSCPIWISSNAKHITSLNLFGAGLLIGVSLGIIIPEGVRGLYSAKFNKMKSNLPCTIIK